MADLDESQCDQHFCLRWNNFQANITSQFEVLRYEEDFTDVTIACEGQRLQAHKVVLSACSPYFKELFKANPCSHPIIFMRDVEARHIIALMEFMYVGEVNVSQAHLSTFLKTAESLKIRGLTDTSSESDVPEENSLYMKPQPLRSLRNNMLVSKNKPKNLQISSTNSVTSSQDVPLDIPNLVMPVISSPAPKRSKSETEIRLRKDDSMTVNPFALQNESRNQIDVKPKMELPEYISDDDNEQDDSSFNFYSGNDGNDFSGGIDMIPQTSSFNGKDAGAELNSQGLRRRRRVSDQWLPYGFHQSSCFGNSYYDAPSRIFEKRDTERRSNKLVKLGEGIEIYEDQLRSIKWSDYRKLTRGLATILFSPAELASCSVTGQRWSRAGNGERPVKPALDRAKVQAIISYVAARFPMVEVSRIKQVLAYKCKENSTAFKMKAVRYYGHGAANAKVLVKNVEEGVFLTYGAPQYLMCDNGVQMKSKDFQSLCQKYRVKIFYTASYNPRADPVERVNRVVKTMIRTYIKNNDHRTWDENLASIACAIRTSRHETTGYTPYFVNFGKEHKLFGQDHSTAISTANSNLEDYVKQKVEVFQKVYADVQKRIKTSQDRNRHHYNLRRRPAYQFTIGQEVWRKNKSISDAANYYSAKLAPEYLGPFRIKRKTGTCTYELEDLSGKTGGVWHVENLKPLNP